jgi:hypothetical protein
VRFARRHQDRRGDLSSWLVLATGRLPIGVVDTLPPRQDCGVPAVKSKLPHRRATGSSESDPLRTGDPCRYAGGPNSGDLHEKALGWSRRHSRT